MISYRIDWCFYFAHKQEWSTWHVLDTTNDVSEAQRFAEKVLAETPPGSKYKSRIMQVVETELTVYGE
jgi:hypothetical protein